MRTILVCDSNTRRRPTSNANIAHRHSKCAGNEGFVIIPRYISPSAFGHVREKRKVSLPNASAFVVHEYSVIPSGTPKKKEIAARRGGANVHCVIFSLSIILAKSGKEVAFIFRIAWPR